MAGGMWCAWHFSAKGHLSGSGPPRERGRRVRSQLLVPTLFIPDALPPVSLSLPGSPALEQSGPSSVYVSRPSPHPKPYTCGCCTPKIPPPPRGDGMCRIRLSADKSRRTAAPPRRRLIAASAGGRSAARQEERKRCCCFWCRAVRRITQNRAGVRRDYGIYSCDTAAVSYFLTPSQNQQGRRRVENVFMHYSTSSRPLLTFTLVALHSFWVSVCDSKGHFISKAFRCACERACCCYPEVPGPGDGNFLTGLASLLAALHLQPWLVLPKMM